jgi:hypothetical protein
MREFYGQSYLADPRGNFVAMGSRDQDFSLKKRSEKGGIA